MSEKPLYLKSIGEAYRAWKNAEQYESQQRFKRVFDKLLHNYLTMFFINLGVEGKRPGYTNSVIRGMQIPPGRRTVEYFKLAQFGDMLAVIRNYDLKEEKLDAFRKQIFEMKL